MAAEITSTDVAAIIAAVASVVAVGVLIVGVVALTRTLTAVRLTVEQLRRETLPVIDEVHKTVVQANAELVRVDGLLDTAQSVSSTVDSASHLAFLFVGNPLMKAVAAGSGALRAARSFRRRK